jgi:hypothetical protein
MMPKLLLKFTPLTIIFATLVHFGFAQSNF